MSSIDRFLYFLSFTDTSIIESCSDYAKKTQKMFGFIVLAVGIVAFITMLYIMNLVFPESIWNVFLALLYSSFIIAIDRMVVSSRNHLKIAPRIILATVIAVVIAVPLELAIFHEQIEKQANIVANQEVDSLKVQIQSIQASIDVSQEECQIKIDSYRNRILNLSEIRSNEELGIRTEVTTGERGNGPQANRRLQEQQEVEELLQGTREDCIQESKKYESRIELLQSQIQNSNTEVTRGLLTDLMLLQSIRKDNGFVNVIAIAIMLIILALELTPAIMKITWTQTDYDVLIERYIQDRIQEIQNNSKSIEKYVTNSRPIDTKKIWEKIIQKNEDKKPPTSSQRHDNDDLLDYFEKGVS